MKQLTKNSWNIKEITKASGAVASSLYIEAEELIVAGEGSETDIPQNSFAFLVARAELTRARSTSPEWISALRLITWESSLFCSISLLGFLKWSRKTGIHKQKDVYIDSALNQNSNARR